MKVLITGGAGFIGQRTAQLLLSKGHQVSVLDNLAPPVHGEGKYRCPKDGDVYPEPRRAEALERGTWDPPCPVCQGPATPMVTDESVVRPASAYGLSKLAQEQLVRLLGERHDINWLILRYGAVQGRAQPFQNASYGALRIFALRLYHHQPPLLLEDGNQLRDFVDVDGVARANLAALSDLPTGAYNVPSGRPHTVSDLART